MTYKLLFHPAALSEWQQLAAADQQYFKAKLKQRLERPHIPSARLSGGIVFIKLNVKGRR